MSTIWTFDGIENGHEVYRGKDCIKKLCESLREHTMKINFERKKIMSLIMNIMSLNHILIKQTVTFAKKVSR